MSMECVHVANAILHVANAGFHVAHDGHHVANRVFHNRGLCYLSLSLSVAFHFCVCPPTIHSLCGYVFV